MAVLLKVDGVMLLCNTEEELNANLEVAAAIMNCKDVVDSWSV